MRVAVVGNGLLGSTIGELSPSGGSAVMSPSGDNRLVVTVLSHDDIDITSHSSIRAALNLHRPDVVINTAAFHDVMACEDDPERAFDLNARAADKLARLVPTVFISTDYLFWDDGPHTESMPGGTPRSVYGRSKLAGELATLEHGGIVVRVASLYGHHPSRKGLTFPQKVLSSHDPMRLATDQVMSPTYVPDAARIITALAWSMATGKKGLILGKSPVPPSGIYHATNKGSTSWAEFAEHILALTGHKRHVLPYEAKDRLRPRDSSLKSTRLPQLPHWMDGLGRWAQREGRMTIVSPLRD